MFRRILSFYKTSQPSAEQVSAQEVDGYYKKLRMQAFIAGTVGYSLYYVCRLSLSVMKDPIVKSGMLDEVQLGLIAACLYWAYAAGKFVSGFLADHSDIKKFMATGLIVSALANFIMGILGFSASAGTTSSVVFVMFAIVWGINGWVQSMGSPSAIIALSRWYPQRIKGTYYGFFSASHNIGEGLSFIFVSLLVSVAGWQWGFFGAALAGVLGVILVVMWLHDTPESKGLPSIEEYAGETVEGKDADSVSKAEAGRIQRMVLRNPGVWILALASAFMYMSRYAINEWGMFFLQNEKGFEIGPAGFIIGINTIAGIAGTVFSGWLSDKLFNGDRKYPAFAAGILESIALVLFLYGGDGWFVNILAMVLFGIAIGVLISFVGGLMAVDLVPRKATGAALGIVGLASYVAAGLMNVISGVLINDRATYVPVEVESSIEASASYADIADYDFNEYVAALMARPESADSVEIAGFDTQINELAKSIESEKDTIKLTSLKNQLTIAKFNKEQLLVDKEIRSFATNLDESRDTMSKLICQNAIMGNGVDAIMQREQNYSAGLTAGIDSLDTVIAQADAVYKKRNPEYVKVYDFSYVSVFWIASAIIAFLLPVLNWKRKKMEV